MRFLDLLQPLLLRHGHACCRVDGSQGAEERDTQARRSSTIASPRGAEERDTGRDRTQMT